MTSRQTHKSKPLTLGDVALHLAGLMNRVRAIENLTAVDQRPVDDMRSALRQIALLPCDCARMNAFVEFKTTREVVIKGQGTSHHWLGCHVAIAAAGFGGPM